MGRNTKESEHFRGYFLAKSSKFLKRVKAALAGGLVGTCFRVVFLQFLVVSLGS
ncbi:MAG: hypothetical protein Q7S53_03595 [bacterium]|nr:hypothetical protein [bacterium]